MSGARHWEQDKEATVYVGNIDERVTDSLIWELMLQAGRIVNVHLPKDRVTQNHQGYGFVEFLSEEEAEYAARIMNQVRLYGKPIRVNKASADKQKSMEVGADLFLGNLDPMVDEKTLYDTFSRFGPLISPPKIARDPETGLSKGYGFVSYATFEASDDAIANMNAQYLMNKDISVQYAYKKDGKGERHGDPAERMLAAQAKAHGVVPEAQPMPPQLLGLPGAVPTGPASMGGYDQQGPSMRGPPPPQMNGGYQGGPPSGPRGALAPPPQGLPQRPPPSQAGYGGPQVYDQGGYAPPPQGFAPPPQGYPPPMPPAGFAPPPGFGPPPGGMPLGFGPAPGGMPPVPPPGFGMPPHGYGQGPPPQGPPGGYGRR